MKTIAIVATGGTIAGTGKKGKTAAYHAGEIDIDSIIEQCQYFLLKIVVLSL